MIGKLKNHIKHSYPGLHKSLVPAYLKLQQRQHRFADWRAVYLDRSSLEIQTPFGFKLTAANFPSNRVMQKGEFELEEIDALKEHWHDTTTFVDVGANIGMYTCLARSAGKHGIAIEPQPRNLNYLYANLNQNNWADTEVFPIGLSDKPGLMTLYGASGPSASLIEGWAGYSRQFKQTIALSTLDIVLGNRFANEQLAIKIDVEGAEYGVLSGASATLARTPKPIWLIEVCLDEYFPNGVNPNYAATFDLFWRQGYEVRTANAERTLIKPTDIASWTSARHASSPTFNYLFLPKA